MVGGAAGPVRLTAWVRGAVQGVGFRWWTRSQALELGLTGWARNTDDGRVEIVAEGVSSVCAELLRRVESGTTPGRVDSVVAQWSDPKGLRGFVER